MNVSTAETFEMHYNTVVAIYLKTQAATLD